MLTFAKQPSRPPDKSGILPVQSAPLRQHPGVRQLLSPDSQADRLEREADAAANRVVGGPMPARQRGFPGMVTERSSRTSTAPGRALPHSLLRHMGGAFSADFSAVRVHTDPSAAHMSAGLGAEAFTQGRHIYFGTGRFDPHSAGGRWLLAHELAHTLQQGAVRTLGKDNSSLSQLRQNPSVASLLHGGGGNRPEQAFSRISPRIQRRKSEWLKERQDWRFDWCMSNEKSPYAGVASESERESLCKGHTEIVTRGRLTGMYAPPGTTPFDHGPVKLYFDRTKNRIRVFRVDKDGDPVESLAVITPAPGASIDNPDILWRVYDDDDVSIEIPPGWSAVPTRPSVDIEERSESEGPSFGMRINMRDVLVRELDLYAVQTGDQRWQQIRNTPNMRLLLWFSGSRKVRAWRRSVKMQEIREREIRKIQQASALNLTWEQAEKIWIDSVAIPGGKAVESARFTREAPNAPVIPFKTGFNDIPIQAFMAYGRVWLLVTSRSYPELKNVDFRVLQKSKTGGRQVIPLDPRAVVFVKDMDEGGKLKPIYAKDLLSFTRASFKNFSSKFATTVMAGSSVTVTAGTQGMGAALSGLAWDAASEAAQEYKYELNQTELGREVWGTLQMVDAVAMASSMQNLAKNAGELLRRLKGKYKAWRANKANMELPAHREAARRIEHTMEQLRALTGQRRTAGAMKGDKSGAARGAGPAVDVDLPGMMFDAPLVITTGGGGTTVTTARMPPTGEHLELLHKARDSNNVRSVNEKYYYLGYDIQMEAGAHTYRRRSADRSWCRFSSQDCGFDLNPDLQKKIEEVAREKQIIPPAGEPPTQAEVGRHPKIPPGGISIAERVAQGGEPPYWVRDARRLAYFDTTNGTYKYIELPKNRKNDEMTGDAIKAYDKVAGVVDDYEDLRKKMEGYGDLFEVDHLIEQRTLLVFDTKDTMDPDIWPSLVVPRNPSIRDKLTGFRGYAHTEKTRRMNQLIPHGFEAAYTPQQVWDAHAKVLTDLGLRVELERCQELFHGFDVEFRTSFPADHFKPPKWVRYKREKKQN